MQARSANETRQMVNRLPTKSYKISKVIGPLVGSVHLSSFVVVKNIPNDYLVLMGGEGGSFRGCMYVFHQPCYTTID